MCTASVFISAKSKIVSTDSTAHKYKEGMKFALQLCKLRLNAKSARSMRSGLWTRSLSEGLVLGADRGGSGGRAGEDELEQPC